ncbi:Hypothetical predicted protein [Pelobates cultripes]|uniref:Uncharacterized protein n=1 Tax=Pelobates cultripes TaxID=61616 RepID=A0AAD1T6G0_PELCU|nr:Hypothetical predicted protein [Pelobates cultripes]
MGKKGKSRRSETGSSCNDISTVLRVTLQLRPCKMEPTWEDSDTALEESDQDDSLIPNRHSKPQYLPGTTACEQSRHPEPEMKAQFTVDINLVREALGALTARLQTLEDDGDVAKGKFDYLQTEVDQLKIANLIMEGKMTALEDAKC